MSASIPNRLTLRETAVTLGLNVGQVLQLRAPGGKFSDPTFPKLTRGHFIADEVIAWKKSKEDQATQAPSAQKGESNDKYQT